MEELIRFFHQVGRLKRIKREGWVRKDIPQPESVAEHTFRMAMIAWMMATKLGLDTEKCIKMALVHDLAESITGDITPEDAISSEEKYLLEKNAMLEILEGIAGEEIYTLWEEYAAKMSPEAQMVNDIDKFEFALQSFEYEQDLPEKRKDLKEFWESARKKMKTDLGRDLLATIEEKKLAPESSSGANDSL